MEIKCENCRFSFVGELDKNPRRSLHCRRFPPIAVFVSTQERTGVVSVFPGVDADSWCGEFEPIPKPNDYDA